MVRPIAFRNFLFSIFLYVYGVFFHLALTGAHTHKQDAPKVVLNFLSSPLLHLSITALPLHPSSHQNSTFTSTSLIGQAVDTGYELCSKEQGCTLPFAILFACPATIGRACDDSTETEESKDFLRVRKQRHD